MKKKAIIVLGMHRSGTSAITGVLNKLGVSLGSKLMESNEYNKKGYFENSFIVDVNEEILKILGSSWDSLFPLEEGWWKSPQLSIQRDKIKDIIKQEFGSTELFSIKDPRICILFPLWISIIRELNIEPVFIVTLRNPVDVAKSLRNREGFSIQKGIFLWTNYMLDAEYYSRGFKRVFVKYDKLLLNSGNVVGYIANSLGLDFPRKWEDEKKTIEDFLDAGIKKQYGVDDAANHHIPKYIRDYYSVLLNIADQDTVGKVDQLHMETFRKRHFDQLRTVYRHHYGMKIQTSSKTTDIEGENPREMKKDGMAISTEDKTVSIVVVNYNGSKYLEPLFNSLLGMDRENVFLEIIMVDNLSGDDSVSLVKETFPEIIVVENEVNNFARALNLGIDHAGGDYIAFLNNDMVVDGHWLKGLLDVMDGDEKIGAVQSKILFMGGERINSVGVEEVKDFYFRDIGFEEQDHGQYEIVKEIDYFTNGSVLVRRACIDSVGSIDEDFIMFFEDVDFSLRCRKAGWKLLYSPQSIVYHKYHGSTSSEMALFFCSRNRLLCLAKHFPLKLPGSVKTSAFYANHETENLYQSLIQAARKLIADHTAETSLKVLVEIKDVLSEIYGIEKTHDFFSQVEVLTGLKQIKMGIYDNLLKFTDAEAMKAGELVRKPSFYLSQVAGPLYMSAMLDRPVLALFNQVSEVTRLLQKSEHDRAARLEQVHELTAMLKESEADRAARLEQIHELTAMLKESEADRAARLEQVYELIAMPKESEADRAARLEVIHRLEEDLRTLEDSFIVRLARRLHLLNARKFEKHQS